MYAWEESFADNVKGTLLVMAGRIVDERIFALEVFAHLLVFTTVFLFVFPVIKRLVDSAKFSRLQNTSGSNSFNP